MVATKQRRYQKSYCAIPPGFDQQVPRSCSVGLRHFVVGIRTADFAEQVCATLLASPRSSCSGAHPSARAQTTGCPSAGIPLVLCGGRPRQAQGIRRPVGALKALLRHRAVRRSERLVQVLGRFAVFCQIDLVGARQFFAALIGLSLVKQCLA